MFIFPSLLGSNISDIQNEILSIESESSGLHFDIGDGEFVASKMLSWDLLDSIKTPLPIDLHLMVNQPSQYLTLLNNPHVTACAIHVECREDIHQLIQTIHNHQKKAWLAIMLDTPTDHLDQYALEVDYVLVMSVTGGKSGDPFHPEALKKVTEIHQKMPDTTIIMDGGISDKNIKLCHIAWANWVVIGSALFKQTDRKNYIKSLEKIVRL